MTLLLIVSSLFFLMLLNMFLIKPYLLMLFRFSYYKNHELMYEILEKSKKLAYAKLFNENILVEVSNKTKLNSDQVTKLSKQYVNLIYLYSGKKLINDLIEVYTSEESFIANLTSEFIIKIISDELEYYSKQAEDYIGTNDRG